ncbi:leucine-rich repeat protein 1 [Uranotaenia lowii]|uniref:leucine-rich repeat protein 1 n=1 Tax=Uranotaenia lowii TaxID=190385 RepID=UPI002478FD35|nr:leucine-rich repeat protein 1 [Uranotaenia lowii]
MKLVCETCLVKRSAPPVKRPFQRSILAIGRNREKKTDETVIMLITNANKSGTQYAIKNNIGKVFTRFLSDGKATISFKIPDQDMQIKCDTVQLSGFLKVLKSVVSGEAIPNENSNPPKLSCLTMANRKTSVLSSTSKSLSTRCVVKSRGDYPIKGFSRNLVSLQISEIKLTRFDPQILLLKNLRSLNLSDNCLDMIPKALGQLRIAELNLSGNSLQKDRWEWLQEHTIQSSLQNLNIGSNNLAQFPINIIYLRMLVNLNMQANHIQKLPFAIWKMTRLRFMNLSGNQLGSIPESMVRMKLDQVDLSENQLAQNQVTVPDLRLQQSDIRQTPALWELAARVVVARKIHYSIGMIPFLLVELMHRTPICACGLLCFTSRIHERAKVIRLNCQHTIINSNHAIYADSVFCSQRCSSRI